MKSPVSLRPRSARPQRQRGVVLLFSLIALTIMLIAAAALVRSFNSSLFNAGNIAFKRDLQNQGERAVERVLVEFRTGGTLAAVDVRAGDVKAENYSATMLPVNAQGIPVALQNDVEFLKVGVASKDFEVASQAVKIRYVVDRLCATAGDESTLAGTQCVVADNPPEAGVGLKEMQGAGGRSLGKTCTTDAAGTVTCVPTKAAGSKGTLFRLSVKVTGPRNTQSFFQSTFTIPS